MSNRDDAQATLTRSNTALSIQDLVRRWARDTPAAVAVDARGLRFTYAELDEQSDQFSRYLTVNGVSAGGFVAAYLDRSANSVITLLAILRAGAAFVPLGAEYPEAQICLLLEQVGHVILLTGESPTRQVPGFSGSRVQLPTVEAMANPLLANVPACAAQASIAFVLFTSGSTGTPKGVLQEHRSYCNLAAVHADNLDMRPGARALMFGSTAHGSAISTIVITLANGATLCGLSGFPNGFLGDVGH